MSPVLFNNDPSFLDCEPLQIRMLLRRLADKRPLFHSEADFQHALAWEIHQQIPTATLRLELPFFIDEKALHLDLWVEYQDQAFAIELKYKTRKFAQPVQLGQELYRLKDHSAQDCGRYDFLKDVWRLEQIVRMYPQTVGFAIFLTNDSSYWKSTGDKAVKPADAAFRLGEGRVIQGECAWRTDTSPGTIVGREQPIVLNGCYTMTWEAYSELLKAQPGLFRYLASTVARFAE